MLQNPNNTEQKFSDSVVQLIQRSLEQNLDCPFEDVNFILPNNVRCPVCGSLGGMDNTVYCISDFKKPS